MKRSSLLITFAIMLAAISASACLASDGMHMGCFPTDPDGYLSFKMQQGWFADELVWFITTDTNSIKFATDYNLTLAPKLSSALGSGAQGEVFYVCNFRQGPVFSTAPTQPDYTPIFQVNTIAWKDVRLARPITNVNPASLSNPNGIPDSSLVTVTATNTVVDSPILAVGPLGGPWFPAVAGSYRIPQGKVYTDYIYTKEIELPFFLAYCQNQLTRAISEVQVIVPDAADQLGATTFGANLAPALNVFPASDSQRLWCFNNTTGCSEGCEIPVEEWCPTSNSFRNTQFNYSPIEFGTRMDRHLVPISTVINSRDSVLFLISKGLLTPTQCCVFNTPIRLMPAIP